MLRHPAWAYVKGQRNRAAVAAGNSDQARVIAPVTKGAATLVRSGLPWEFDPRMKLNTG